MLRRLLDSPRTYYALAALLLLVALVTQFELQGPTRPAGGVEDLAPLRTRGDLNVLFVLVDTLRSDRLGAYGYERPTSPWIDELARTGIRFADVVAQSSWTKTSMASLWTGTYPARNGVLRWGHALPGAALMPAERLAQAGFRTAGIFRNGWVAANFGFGQGFHDYVRPIANSSGGEPTRSLLPHERLEGSDEDITYSAIEFLRTFEDERFLLYLHYMDVHQYTYNDESALFGTSYSDAYDNAIHWTDQNLGVLLRELDALGLRERTLVVIASDHGEEFLEHGNEGHAKGLYREVVGVPLVIGLPFRFEPGIVVEQRIANVDLWPTLFDLLGLPALPGVDGQSRIPWIEAAARGEASGPASDEGAVFAQIDRRWGRPEETPRPLVRVADGRFSLLAGFGGDDDGMVRLFDLDSDPGEQRDLAESQPDEAARLKVLVNGYLARPPVDWGAPLEVEIDELERGQLRALGYLVH